MRWSTTVVSAIGALVIFCATSVETSYTLYPSEAVAAPIGRDGSTSASAAAAADAGHVMVTSFSVYASIGSPGARGASTSGADTRRDSGPGLPRVETPTAA